MRLLLIRHGHPDYATDSLTELGVRQAEALATRLSREPIAAIYSSSCGRALQTAAPTAKVLGLPVVPLDFMREICWGPADARWSEDYHPWRLGHRLAREGNDLLTYDYEHFYGYHGTELETSFRKVSEGLDAFLLTFGYERAGNAYRLVGEGDDRTIALFAHAGAGGCVMAHLLGLPPLYIFGRSEMSFTGITVFDFRRGDGEYVSPDLVTYNEYGHIDALEKAENVIGN